ncbi:hypothetical protein Tco_1200310 [Tanacetum coccineum]
MAGKTGMKRLGVTGCWFGKLAKLVLQGSSGTGLLPSGRSMIHNELSNSAKIDSSKGETGGGVVDLTGDEDHTDDDGDNNMGDLTGGSIFLGGVEGAHLSDSKWSRSIPYGAPDASYENSLQSQIPDVG